MCQAQPGVYLQERHEAAPSVAGHRHVGIEGIAPRGVVDAACQLLFMWIPQIVAAAQFVVVKRSAMEAFTARVFVRFPWRRNLRLLQRTQDHEWKTLRSAVRSCCALVAMATP